MHSIKSAAAIFWSVSLASPAFAFQPSVSVLRPVVVKPRSIITSFSAATDEDVATIQILMSDTGGGHRASAVSYLMDLLSYVQKII